MDLYAAIKEKYGVACDPSDESYLWVPEAEWMRPDEILDYKPPAYQQPGFVPFAFTGAGEPWCWWPEQNSHAVVSLLIGFAGTFDAPDLIGSIYRRFIEYAVEVDEEDDETARSFLTQWTRQLKDYLPASWIDTLRRLAQAESVSWEAGKLKIRGLLALKERDKLFSRDLAFPRLGEEFEWTTG
jgi:hypothetical protein